MDDLGEDMVPVFPKRRKEDRPPRRQRKGMYILPSLFTTANLAAGYYAILQVMHGTVGEAWHFDFAAEAIGFAVLFDGLDGRIARLTKTSSDFGKELDSLADVITFGVAPALLAYMWGFHLLSPSLFSNHDVRTKVMQFGAIASFLFLVAGASRLARFNIQTNPQPSNPGKPDKKYFVGMPIPAGAGVIAAVVHFTPDQLPAAWMVITWLLLVLAVGYLMVSTWRFYSFKDIHFNTRQPFRIMILLAAIFVSIWYYSRVVLFGIALIYMFSGVWWRLQWIVRRRPSPPAPPAYQEASQHP
jgi:CDP-diacylglycerol--serine O-phosphatidyltransferase